MKSFLIIALLLTSIPAFADTLTDYQITKLSYKVRDIGYGYVELSIKIDVQNQGTPGNIWMSISCFDNDGFEMQPPASLAEHFDPNESKSVTTLYRMKTETYNACNLRISHHHKS